MIQGLDRDVEAVLIIISIRQFLYNESIINYEEATISRICFAYFNSTMPASISSTRRNFISNHGISPLEMPNYRILQSVARSTLHNRTFRKVSFVMLS